MYMYETLRSTLKEGRTFIHALEAMQPSLFALNLLTDWPFVSKLFFSRLVDVCSYDLLSYTYTIYLQYGITALLSNIGIGQRPWWRSDKGGPLWQLCEIYQLELITIISRCASYLPDTLSFFYKHSIFFAQPGCSYFLAIFSLGCS